MSIEKAVRAKAWTLVGAEIFKAQGRLSVHIRKAGAAAPNIAALNEIATGYREVAKGKNRLNEAAQYLAEGFNNQNPEHPAYWHRNGLSGNGNSASFHAHPDPVKMAKADKAGDAVTVGDDGLKDDSAPATVSESTPVIAESVELSGDEIISALSLALENGVLTLAEVEAVCVGFAARAQAQAA